MFSTEIHYEVVTFAIGDTKSGTKMGKLQLKNPENGETLNCIMWEEALNRMDLKLFRCGNILRIVSASFNEKFNNCLVNALELIKEAKTGLDESEREKTYKEILAFIDKIKDEKLKDFVSKIYSDNKDKILVMPAAKLMHHNYIGGLMVHTLECLKYAEVNMDNFFQRVNRDEVYAACLLHDIGKIFEYTIDLESGLIDYDENFRKEWISHSQYGFTICMAAGFKRVAKMIAAHHARADWGAIVDLNEKDLEPFVYLIHHIDDMSAKFGMTNVAMLGGKND
ncbi:MAG: HD domain-containing protein [Candidatus Gastranaerophilales bacterium]|nr:HD domain-containing protein [Candidatus Gastranaerophilales bacterium]MCM1073883.1 HD domain-containing protein [Bacteroides sp.]